MAETKDLSIAELNEGINRFNVDSGEPEQPPVKKDLAHWLQVDHEPQVTMRELEGGLKGFGIVLENLLSRKECLKIIEETEATGFGHLGTNKTGMAYRGNRRLQMDDTGEKLGAEIWRRIKKFIPEVEELPDDGTFKFYGMNPRYRFAKYFAGEGFAIHIDKPTIYEHDIISVYTVNIYLNDLSPEQGGQTRFYRKLTGGKPIAAVGGLAGSCAIFKQALVDYSPVHDGGKVESGLKYLMRTDIVYANVKAENPRSLVHVAEQTK